MRRTLPLVTAFVVVIGSGIAHGLWTDRWSTSEELRHAAERVGQIPLDVGDWRGEEKELSELQRTLGDIKGYRSRNYVHRVIRTNELQFLIVCGDPRYISVHTPEVCYEGAGYSQVGPPQKHTVTPEGGEPATFQVGLFRHTEAGVPVHLRIFWAFATADGRWVAPDEPRLAFSRFRHRYLYKIYVIRQLARPDEPLDTDPCNDFLKQMLPELPKALFPPSPVGS